MTVKGRDRKALRRTLTKASKSGRGSCELGDGTLVGVSRQSCQACCAHHLQINLWKKVPTLPKKNA